MQLLKRYWGLVAFVGAVVGWVGLVAGSFASSAVAVILILSVGALVYVGFRAPLHCGAIIRDGKLCRNNCYGLLMGCYLRQHKWQKLKMVFVAKAWRELNRGLWATPKEGINTLVGLSTVVSALAAVVVIFK